MSMVHIFLGLPLVWGQSRLILFAFLKALCLLNPPSCSLGEEVGFCQGCSHTHTIALYRK
jgi:hypothetical protein